MFSRDPEAVRLEGKFEAIYALFVPFFFINIGYRFDPRALGSAASLGMALFAAAVAGKFVGAGAPLLFREGVKGATILGVSMAPRAEIALLRCA
jgi:Kef-type K+ transport system membrane component KefB